MAITKNQSKNLKLDKRYITTNAHPLRSAFMSLWESNTLVGLGAFYAILTLVLPGFAVLLACFCYLILIPYSRYERRFPLRMPQSYGKNKTDYNDPKAGSDTKFNTARGITVLGMDAETGLQLYECSDIERQHNLTLATTGSGKTFGLRFHLSTSMATTSGVIGIDGKGDIELPLDALSLFRRFGREDDVRILNFKQGARNIYSENGIPRTNTFNPFSTGSSTYIGEMLKALLSDDDPKAGSGDIWKKRAESMCDNIAKMATHKRDHTDFKIRPGTIAHMLELKELCKIYCDKEMPDSYKLSLRTYFATLPEFYIEKLEDYADGTEEFSGKIMEQHGYVVMQLQPALQVLSEQYGFIFDTDTPEIDLKDVVINNRILLGLLPAMEQSLGTLKDTGKIILAALKGMISGELGEKYEGSVKEILDERACNDEAPFKCYFDECGYYAAINGIEILPAQGRGLGFAFYFIGQTFTDLKKGGDETAEIIWGNTNTKSIGKTESHDTFKKVEERLGEVELYARDRIDLEDNITGGTSRRYADTLSITKRQRVQIGDFTSLREGEFFLISRDELIKIRTGDPVLPKPKNSRYNQLVGLDPIDDDLKVSLRRNFSKALIRFKEYSSGNYSKATPDLRLLGSLIAEHTRARASGQNTNLSPFVQWQHLIYQVMDSESAEQTQKTASEIAAIMEQSTDIKGSSTQEPDAETKDMQPEQPPQKSSVPSSTQNDSSESDWTTVATTAMEKIGDYDDKDGYIGYTDYGDDEDDDVEEFSELDAEIEFLNLQLKQGRITEEEFQSEVEALLNEYQNAEDELDEEDDFSVSTVSGVEFSHNNSVTDPVKESNIGTSVVSDDALEYPSSSAKEMGSAVTASEAIDLLEDIELQFSDLDI